MRSNAFFVNKLLAWGIVDCLIVRFNSTWNCQAHKPMVDSCESAIDPSWTHGLGSKEELTTNENFGCSICWDFRQDRKTVGSLVCSHSQKLHSIFWHTDICLSMSDFCAVSFCMRSSDSARLPFSDSNLTNSSFFSTVRLADCSSSCFLSVSSFPRFSSSS